LLSNEGQTAYNQIMFKGSKWIAACIFLVGFGYCQKQSATGTQPQAISGAYVALEEMPNISPDEPNAKWFHENTLLVRNNEAILYMAPVWFKKGKKFYSASDGGFLTYRGRFFQKDGLSFLELRLFESDYVAFPVGSDPYKELTTRNVKLTSGALEIEGVRYQRTVLIKYAKTVLGKRRRKELLDSLNLQPMEKPAP
jgi:hypothetical protein